MDMFEIRWKGKDTVNRYSLNLPITYERWQYPKTVLETRCMDTQSYADNLILLAAWQSAVIDKVAADQIS